MLGAIIGDIAGSRFEFDPIKTTEFELIAENSTWTDDSVMTLALADAILIKSDISSAYRRWVAEYPTSYGHHFWDWACDPAAKAYGSYGNGASMRVSPAAWLSSDLVSCLDLAKRSAEVSHDHPEGIRGAQATAAAVYAGLVGWKAPQIRRLVEDLFGYDLSPAVKDIRPKNVFEIKSWLSVPQAMACAFEAASYEEAVRLAVSLGGDADTQAAIAGSIAEPMFGIPDAIRDAAMPKLTERMAEVLAASQLAASKLKRAPITREVLASVPRWNQQTAKDWDDDVRRRFEGPPDPKAEAELARVLALTGGTFVAPPSQPRRSLWKRLLRG